MPTGSELLKQLQQRRAQPAAVTSAPKIASPKVPTVAAITASVEDEWITDERVADDEESVLQDTLCQVAHLIAQ